EFRGQLRVLPVSATDLQRHCQFQCRHVRVTGAACTVAELHCPVRMSLGASDLGSSSGELFTPLECHDFRMILKLSIQCVLVKGDCVDRGLACEASVCGIANPPSKSDPGSAHGAGGFERLILEFGHDLSCCQYIGRRTPSTAISRL